MENVFTTFTRDIARLYRAVQKIKSAEMESMGLKGTHVMCLFHLYRHSDGLTPAQLASECNEDKAAVSRNVADLKQHGLAQVQSQESKTYRAHITLTEKGLTVAREIEKKVESAVTAGGSFMTDKERDAFYQTLSRIADNLENYIIQLEGKE
ncbi:MAG: MarR family transcriptional regulator [Clostridiales bacterium]|nr:MarR family transcriptional regulator [Clostridiales bacterium]